MTRRVLVSSSDDVRRVCVSRRRRTRGVTFPNLSYSRAEGVFAVVSLEGSTLRSDGGANKDVYGKELDAKQIVTGSSVTTTPAGKPLVDALTKKSPKNLSENK